MTREVARSRIHVGGDRIELQSGTTASGCAVAPTWLRFRSDKTIGIRGPRLRRRAVLA